ncbi:regulation of nuclear pre-mRNA domain-containing protein 1B-like [Acanthaster planci]|uniref:Regulation of nuclear pre-mRNA domain-containing protein 1B-like n=1 Tax=Acanthaster planci TaxID=133434 RepID=A0A8B7YG06_ACAPL|nr:regulation of nuclear pre-mRNA domain-containing protein 1B-like [Acanthaster planci]
MSSFSDSTLTEKLAALTNSQQSIQTMSLWLIHHRKHARKIVKTWYIELKRAKAKRKLVFIYLANDVVQNGKKKGTEFTKEFGTVIDHAFSHVLETAEDEKTRKALARVLSVWAERNVFNSQLLYKMTTLLSGELQPPSKKARHSEPQQHHHHHHRQHSRPAQASPAPPDSDSQNENSAKKEKFEGSFGEKFEALHGLLGQDEDGEEGEEEEQVDAEDVPEPDEIIQALNDMDNSASSDAVVREKIAKLPPEVQDVSLLDKIQGREEADRLSTLVNDACSLLDDYNVRLSLELEDRQHVMKMLKNYRISQHQKLKEAEDKLKEFLSKHDKVTSVRKELASHIQNLPDLTLLPDVTGGLAPLPSAGDLFSV